MYALRRVKDAFREHKSLRDPSDINANLKEARKFLDIIKRQVTFVVPTQCSYYMFFFVRIIFKFILVETHIGIHTDCFKFISSTNNITTLCNILSVGSVNVLSTY